MLCNIKLIILALAATIAVALAEATTITTDKTTVPALEMAVQVKQVESENNDETIHYTCTYGKFTTENLLCYARDTKDYLVPHNIDLKLLCPKEGHYDKDIGYVRIDFTVTSDNLNCEIIRGGINQGFIGIHVVALATKKFQYDAQVYSK